MRSLIAAIGRASLSPRVTRRGKLLQPWVAPFRERGPVLRPRVILPRLQECADALECKWTWTRNIWAEAERIHGAPLGVQIDESGPLAAVDRIYGW